MQRNRLVIGLIGIILSIQADANTTHQYHKKKHVRMKDETVYIVRENHHSFLGNIFNSTNRPEWLTHTYISYAFQRNNKPITELATTQPFYQDCFNTIFGQGRVATFSGYTDGNLGAGYRVLTESNHMMWGLNAFLDHSSQYSNSRVSIGGEMFTPYIVLRADYYDKISGTKTISTSPGVANYARALRGYDLSIETPFPYISWMRFVLQGYRYVGNKTSGANGGIANLRIFPARQVEIDAGYSADNRNGRMPFMKIDYYFGSPDFIENTMTSPNYYGAYAPVNVERQRLQKVVRHNDIVFEKTNSTAQSAGVVDVRAT